MSALLQFKHMFTINSNASSECDDHYSSGIPSFPKTMSWDESATDYRDWDGVTCDGLTGHVVGLDLSCSQLHGKIHPNSSLSKLSHLQRLNLAYNDFNGSRMSYAFGSFASLTHLNLSHSALSGSILGRVLEFLQSQDDRCPWTLDLFLDFLFGRMLALCARLWYWVL
ncbi:hypothetical protein RHSIM_RhsimUnG0081300 [Rhododendron simsii]|uniref:Leucine-rich repeat-containing N-terminal plant-type domain-containing protein n=1 Tax=Rhododendron simsii TaxID=118357 RepID=A0A834FVG2_RHOSS|nr:hypothetical protein RHSIM_RhsimUnG0081300 [Rhododendron simsii]